MKLRFIIGVIIFSFISTINAQLFINEVSQGTGNKEYVELIVVGTPDCNDSTANLQGWILDDNCGFFGTVGIAAGHIKFANDPQWASIKFGTIITIYRGDDIFPGIFADETDSNNDDKYVLPSTSNFFDRNTGTPTGGTAITSYTTSGYTNGSGDWDMLSMANSSDVFQTVNPNNLSTAYHSVGWGGGIAGTDVYFPTSASGLSFVNQNLNSNDPRDPSNWVQVDASLEGTPSSLNSPPNGDWITFLLNQSASSITPVTNNLSICTNNSVDVGIVNDTIQSVTGCDSVYNVINTYLVSITTNSINACTDDNLQIGISSDTIFSIGGCDSVYNTVNTSLVVATTDSASYCTNESSNVGIVKDTLNSSLGCDSIYRITKTYLVSIVEETINCSNNCVEGIDTVYSVGGCDSIYTTTIINNVEIKIPTAFSPNGDGVNDTFRIVNEQDFTEIIFTVYNRWGELIFQSSDAIIGWDGFYKNARQEVDTYIYYVNAVEKSSQEKISISGSVILIK